MRIGFFLRHPFHDSILRPVFELLQPHHTCRMFLPEVSRNANNPFPMAPLRACIEEMMDFRPHVILSGENIGPLRMRYYMPFSLFVHTRHGLASKGIAYGSVRATDYACVSSPFMHEWYCKAGVMPRREFWVIGNVQVDPLFRSKRLGLPFNIPAGKKIILYAPTFQWSLSSAHLLGDRVVELLRGDRTDVAIVIKPHPLIADAFPQWMQVWRTLSVNHPEIYLVEDTHCDVIPFLQAADVLVSDVSSVLLQFLALDRPIILITSPHRFDESYFDPNGPEWQWRDMGQEIEDVSMLPQAIGRALEDPTLGGDRRAHYRQLLFGDLTDGRARERLGQKVSELEAIISSERRLWLGKYIGYAFMRAVKLKSRCESWYQKT